MRISIRCSPWANLTHTLRKRWCSWALRLMAFCDDGEQPLCYSKGSARYGHGLRQCPHEQRRDFERERHDGLSCRSFKFFEGELLAQLSS
jgi:hypothetical protein